MLEARSLLPKFMEGYAPDAVAIGKPRNIAIEVVAGDKPGAAVEALKERLAAQDAWDLRVYYYRPEHEAEVVAPATRGAIEAAAARVEALVSGGLSDAALLLGWSVLEAAGRLLSPERLGRPQEAGRLIERFGKLGLSKSRRMCKRYHSNRLHRWVEIRVRITMRMIPMVNITIIMPMTLLTTVLMTVPTMVPTYSHLRVVNTQNNIGFHIALFGMNRVVRCEYVYTSNSQDV